MRGEGATGAAEGACYKSTKIRHRSPTPLIAPRHYYAHSLTATNLMASGEADKMVYIDFTVREDDGAAWYESGKIVINLRWLNFDWEVENYILECVIHEYIEHVMGLGHRAASFVEKVIRGLLLEINKTDNVETKDEVLGFGEQAKVEL
ncbi:MAG TPA: hypothetical protein EYH17_05095, partial [Pyrodictium sp.]|nr:hypothetical protein [Pyrodictium sp.]